MGNLDSVVVSKDARPNPSFEKSVSPGFKKTDRSRPAIQVFDGVPIPVDTMRDCLRDAILAPSGYRLTKESDLGSLWAIAYANLQHAHRYFL